MNNKYLSNRKYGWDNLSSFIVGIGVVIWIFTRHGFILAIILMGFAFYRSQSRNIINREKEVETFKSLIKPLLKRIYNLGNTKLFLKVEYVIEDLIYRLQYRMNYITIICPRCNHKLIFNKKKLTTMVLCKKCSLKFRIRS